MSPELDPESTTVPPTSSSTGRCASAVLMRAAVAARVGPQREDIVLGEFIDWYDRVLAAGCRVDEVDGTVTRRRIHTSNTGVRSRDRRGDYARLLKDKLDRRRAEQAESAADREVP